MLTVNFWEKLWKFWILFSFASLVILIYWKPFSQVFIAIILWFKEGVEDADGELNSKDFWLMVYSITLILMGFLQWLTQKPFPREFWAIISVLTTGRIIKQGFDEYFSKQKRKKDKGDGV